MPLRPDVWVVSGDLSQLVLPLGCASCGSATSRARLLEGPAQRELFVPYCGECLERMARGETVSVSVALASSLLSVGLAFAFPALWPGASLAAQVGITLAVAVFPHVLARVLSSAAPGAARLSVRWTHADELTCARRAFAAELAEQNHLALVRRPELALDSPRISWLAPLLGFLLALASYYWHHPTLRVLNLSGARLWLSIDGAEPIAIEASSKESPVAGLALRAPSGERRLVVTDVSGAIVADVRALLDPRHEHLFAPASSEHCFWLESTGYGKERHRRVLPLASESRFWKLEAAVDTWFVASPEPSATDARSTGGTLTALRHAPCERSPFAPAAPDGEPAAPEQNDDAALPAIGP